MQVVVPSGQAVHTPVCADVPVQRTEDEADKYGDDEADEVVVGGAPVGDQVSARQQPARPGFGVQGHQNSRQMPAPALAADRLPPRQHLQVPSAVYVHQSYLNCLKWLAANGLKP